MWKNETPEERMIRDLLEQLPTMQEALWVTTIHGIASREGWTAEHRRRRVNQLTDSCLKAADLAVCQ